MIIIKIGGGNAININGIAEDLGKIDEDVILIHGANYFRDDLLSKLQIEKELLQSVSGFTSVHSTQEIIDSMLMTYSGLRNKRIVETMQQQGINAIGLTGLDGRLIRGNRNKGIKVIENGKKKLKRDLSGKANSVNYELINLLLSNGYVPVLTMPILDENSVAINSENDDIVALLAQEMKPSRVYMLIEESGFIDPKSNSKLDLISSNMLDDLIMNSQGRIQRKLHAIRKTIDEGNCEVIMSDGRLTHPIHNADSGTLFK